MGNHAYSTPGPFCGYYVRMDSMLKIRIGSELLNRVKAKAEAEERTVSSAVRYALKQYLADNTGGTRGE